MSNVLPLAGRIPSFRAEDIDPWNWFRRTFPLAKDWRGMVREVLGELLPQPAGQALIVTQTNSLEPQRPPARLRFETTPVRIGRETDNDIVLPAPAITKHHARIVVIDGSPAVEDLGSALGTMAGERKLGPLEPVRIEDGGVFTIFPYEFRVESEFLWAAGKDFGITDTQVEGGEWGLLLRQLANGFAVSVEPCARQAYVEIAHEVQTELIRRMLRYRPGVPVTPAASDDGLSAFLVMACIERLNREAALPFHFRVGPRGRPPAIGERERGVALGATMTLGGVRGAVRVFLPYALLAAMGESMPGPPSSPPPMATLAMRVSAGGLDLSAAEFSDVESGDVLLYLPRPALLEPRGDRRGWEIRHDAGVPGITLGNLIRTEETVNSTLEDLPLHLEVILGSVELTWKQAGELAPGTVLPFSSESGRVQLSVNGRIVGEGELVEVEGRLGARVVNWRGA